MVNGAIPGYFKYEPNKLGQFEFRAYLPNETKEITSNQLNADYGTGLLSERTLKAPETNPVTKSTNAGVITEYEVVKTAGGEKKISGKVYLVVLSAEIYETFKVDDDVVIGVSKGESENPKTKLMAEAVGADDWTATIKLIPDDKSVEILEPTELSKSSNLTNIRITKGYEFEKKESKKLELTFKIKGKEVKVVKNLDLLPIEIVDNLFKPVNELRIAKWENAYNSNYKIRSDFITGDKDCFYIQIKGAEKLGLTSIEVATEDNPDEKYNDNPTEIEMEGDRSKSMILVSNEEDDDYSANGAGADDQKNDRSHLIQLEGKFKIKSVTINGKKVLTDISVEAKPRYTIDVNFVRVKVDGIIGADEIKNQHIPYVKEVYAQAGLKISDNYIEIKWPDEAVPHDKLGEGYLSVHDDFPKISGNYKKFVDGAIRLGVPEYDIEPFRAGKYPGLTIYYVAYATTQQARGISLPFSNNIRLVDAGLPTEQGKYLNNCFVHSAIFRGTVNTSAHELMHLLSWIDGADHNQQPTNLLVGGVNVVPEIGIRRRIEEQQEEKYISIRANGINE